ncbi:Clarin-3 [Varanus komodoensis]|uniref:Clarin 3 n=1 Tax=Varanus komodoensis TaxID=61221 RepID=A0A8D2KZH2_VARKO|nr:clarin-3 [Varanus komodoensis]KAF7239234.1 Clarin-3 [Varanus komodoensis]
MPSRRKSMMFASAFLTSICSFVIVCLVLATKNWISSEIYYTILNSTGKTTITYGLFDGVCSSMQNDLDTPQFFFQVADMENTKVRTVNIVVIILLVFILLSSLLSSGFTFYNAISNPYQTFLGPVGVYVWNSISCICSLLALILFAVNVEVNDLSFELTVQHCSWLEGYTKSIQTNAYGYSYWIIFLIVFFAAATVIIMVFYQHARYSKRKEQEKPIENAPKDGILF